MEKIWQAAQGLQEELVAIRRDLHKHPETGWTEFRTASFVIKELEKVGIYVHRTEFDHLSFHGIFA